jgi:hypothetical protein
MDRAPPPELELGGGVAGWEDDGATPSTHASTPFLGGYDPLSDSDLSEVRGRGGYAGAADAAPFQLSEAESSWIATSAWELDVLQGAGYLGEDWDTPSSSSDIGSDSDEDLNTLLSGSRFLGMVGMEDSSSAGDDSDSGHWSDAESTESTESTATNVGESAYEPEGRSNMKVVTSMLWQEPCQEPGNTKAVSPRFPLQSMLWQEPRQEPSKAKVASPRFPLQVKTEPVDKRLASAVAFPTACALGPAISTPSAVVRAWGNFPLS